MLNASIILEGTARSVPRNTLLRSARGAVSYGKALEAISRVAGLLHRAGVEPGDRVVLASPNRPGFLYAYFGILKLGAVVVPINPLLRRREILDILSGTGARALLHDDGSPVAGEAASAFAAFGRGAFLARIDEEGAWLGEASADFETARTEAEDAALIQFTSGTTGTPLGVVHTHQSLVTGALAAQRRVEMTEEDACLVALPLSHCFAQTAQMNAGLLCGASLVLMERFAPEAVLRALGVDRPTYFCGVPTMYRAMLDHAAGQRTAWERVTGSLRLASVGGAPVGEELVLRIEDRFRVRVLQGYGLTETLAMGTITPLHGERRPGSVGLPVWGMEVGVVDGEGMRLPAGRRGEVLLRGHAVMRGYHERPDLTREVLREGWLRTGDIGWLDAEGHLHIVGRSKDLIIRGGYNVHPEEVEAVLLRHPEVAEAAVTGVPHERLGEEIRAFVVPVRGSCPGSGALADWARGEMAAYKCPGRIRLVTSLPRGATGKVLRRRLREMSQEEE